MKSTRFFLFICLLSIACSDNSETLVNSPKLLNETTIGSGYFEYTPFKERNNMELLYEVSPLTQRNQL